MKTYYVGRYFSVGAHAVTVEEPPAQECKNVHRCTYMATLSSCKQSHIYKYFCKNFKSTSNDAVTVMSENIVLLCNDYKCNKRVLAILESKREQN